MSEDRYFLTVEWCGKGRRGIFCNSKGTSYSQPEEHTPLEMHDILGPFWLILKPESTLLTEEELAEHAYWRPLAEYCYEFGIARKG